MEHQSFLMLRDTIKNILEHHENFEWSIQGFGMLRCYLSKETRLHIWSHKHRIVSNIHDHPWDFTSTIISGEMVDVSYKIEALNKAHTHEMQIIKCGPGGCADGTIQPVLLKCTGTERKTVGSIYSHKHIDLHESFPSDGCISIIRREFHQDTENAMVAVSAGQKFQFIEPRPATKEEIQEIINNALDKW